MHSFSSFFSHGHCNCRATAPLLLKLRLRLPQQRVCTPLVMRECAPVNPQPLMRVVVVWHHHHCVGRYKSAGIHRYGQKQHVVDTAANAHGRFFSFITQSIMAATFISHITHHHIYIYYIYIIYIYLLYIYTHPSRTTHTHTHTQIQCQPTSCKKQVCLGILVTRLCPGMF